MNVEEAIQARYSCRAFLPDKPVDQKTVEHLLKVSAQAPSGGNLQPWQVFVLSGEPLAALVADVQMQAETLPRGEETEYRIYPKDLKEPYFSRRHKCGEDLYATIGAAREDKQGRLKQYRRNMELFGAPVGLFVYLDRQMQPGQWSDAGMFIQTFMLAAAGHGMATCAQEFWAMWHSAVARYTSPPDDWMLFCGIALGYADQDAPINTLRTDRAEVEEFADFKGF
ncbi:MAG: nitroreductase [Anderseniella sp.]|nr:nitroreductase [Anderseniella sp.]